MAKAYEKDAWLNPVSQGCSCKWQAFPIHRLTESVGKDIEQ